MDYYSFRDLWHRVLQEAHFPITHPLHPEEWIDANSMDRTYRVYLYWPDISKSKPFTVTAEIGWRWDALLSARFATTEEDLLMQIFGDFGLHEDTQPPWLKFDLTLHATIPLNTYFPVPSAEKWRHWVKEGNQHLDTLFSTVKESRLPPRSWHGEPQAEIAFDIQGEPFLQGVEVKAWRGIYLARQWDDPEKWDEEPDEPLYNFAAQLKQVLSFWQESLVLLL